ncbi:transposase [Streptomyces sp. NPDC005474]|uniref:transposase n=1 Tax=Streptomyces sp. NPDC005474 TaxID=3154878 RepID=UPI00345181F2
MASEQQGYDAEFRAGGIRGVIETGKTVKQVATDVGINPGALHSWVSRARRTGSPTSDTVRSSSPGPTAGRLRGSGREVLERLRVPSSVGGALIREGAARKWCCRCGCRSAQEP